jgi:hypothetical protein
MKPNKNFKPSHDRDRDREPSGVNQVNPLDTENQGGDPAELRPRQAHINRNKLSEADLG